MNLNNRELKLIRSLKRLYPFKPYNREGYDLEGLTFDDIMCEHINEKLMYNYKEHYFHRNGGFELASNILTKQDLDNLKKNKPGKGYYRFENPKAVYKNYFKNLVPIAISSDIKPSGRSLRVIQSNANRFPVPVVCGNKKNQSFDPMFLVVEFGKRPVSKKRFEYLLEKKPGTKMYFGFEHGQD